jgi:8-oxo-dGTP pyrophosphatase MutT (NUDIX family)
VLVHRRAGWKDVWPSYWDLGFGGVCGVGEPWVDAAARELREEAGVEVAPAALSPLGRFAFADDRVDAVAEAFEVRHGGPFAPADGEVVELDWVPLGDLAAWAAERDVCPDSLELARTRLLPSGTVPPSPTGEEDPA